MVKFGPISVSAVLITVRIRPIKQIRVKIEPIMAMFGPMIVPIKVIIV